MSESINVARLKKGSETFEVVIHPELALQFRKSQTPPINEVVVYPKVFSDARKGMLASETRMQVVFGTSDALEVATHIVTKGDVNLTAEYKHQLQEQKTRRVIELIHRSGVDPKTKLPHPITRIEAAMKEAKAHIDAFRPAEMQVSDVLKMLRPILPIKFVVKEIEVTLPGAVASKAYPVVKQFGKLLQESWNNDGSWRGVLEVPGGMEQDLYDRLNKIAHGEVSAKVLRTIE